MKWVVRIFAFIGFLVVLVAGGGVWFASHFGSWKAPLKHKKDIILEFSIKGDLAEGPENSVIHLLGRRDMTLHSLIASLDAAARDQRVRGIVFRLDQARLGIAKVQELHNALDRFRAAGKFTIAHADTFGEVVNGTTTYFLASAFDEIALQPMGTLNLVGLAVEMPFARKLLNDLGVDPRFERRKEYKTVLETWTHQDISPQNRESMQSLLDNLLAQIVSSISKHRNIDPLKVREIIDEGPLYKSDEIKLLGLVDHLLYWDECRKHALGKTNDQASLVPLSVWWQETQAKEDSGAPVIALIHGSGEIVRGSPAGEFDFMSGQIINSDEIIRAFDAALKDKRVRAIVFRISSPGGSPVASETILHQVNRARKAGIPVIVSMGEYAASGGYWVASGANKIVANPGTITGSIGVAGGKIFLGRFWDRLGITWGHVKAGKNADMNSLNRDYTPDQWRKQQEHLDYIYAQFLDRVAAGRGLDSVKVGDLAKGRVWTGEQAFKLGLVDVLGDMQKAIELAHEVAKIPQGSGIVNPYPQQEENLLHFLQEIRRGNLPALLGGVSFLGEGIWKTFLILCKTCFPGSALIMQSGVGINYGVRSELIAN